MRTYLLAIALIASTACKGKPKAQPAPGAAKVETQGSGNKAPREIELPHSDGSPIPKTTAPLKPEMFKKLSEMTFPGFNLTVRGLTNDYVWVYQKTPDSPVVRISMHAWTCKHVDNKDCWPQDLAWIKANKMDELKQYLGEELKKAPDTQFEVGETTVLGAKAFWTFQLGQVMGEKHTEFTYCYVLYYHDDFNEMRILAEYKDDLVGNKDVMTKLVPRADLENAAKAFLDVYTHAWVQ